MKNLTDEAPSNGPRKKKSAKWCKGKVGTPHQIEIVMGHSFRYPDRAAPEHYKELVAKGYMWYDIPWAMPPPVSVFSLWKVHRFCWLEELSRVC